MARKNLVRRTKRAIVGAAKTSVARARQIDVKAATAIAAAAAEAAVEAVIKSWMRPESKARRKKTTKKTFGDGNENCGGREGNKARFGGADRRYLPLADRGKHR
jgi:hypothetical protein